MQNGYSLVKVLQDDRQPLPILTKGIFYRNLDFVESDKCGASSRGVRGLDGICLHTFSTRDQDDSKTIAGSASGGKVVGVGPVRDPLLRAFDNPELAILRLRRGRLQTSNI